MAYAVNWVTKVVTIPLSDLTLVSGVNYTLNVDDVHDEVRRLEWEFTDGLWAEYAGEWKDTEILSGIIYSPIFKFVNGYTWEIDASNIIVSLVGINSNLLDTFLPANGVSVLANNSAGKQVVAGGGLSPEQDALLIAIDENVLIVDAKVDLLQLDMTDVWQAHFHRRTWNKVNLMQIYEVDGLTVWKSFDTNSDLSDIDPQ